MNWMVSTTYGAEFDRLAAFITPNHLGYCRKNGYDYNVHHAPFKSPTTYYNANIDLILEMLSYYEGILLIDLDVMFLDWDVRIESLIPEKYAQQIAREELAEGGALFNAGVVILRNRPSTYVFLQSIKRLRPKYGNHCQVWQKQIQDYLLAKDWKVREMNVVDAQVMNAHPWQGRKCSWKPGSPIVHAFCMNQEDKIEQLKQFLPMVKE